MIGRIREQICEKELKLQDWKKEIGYELQEKINRNKVTQLRI